MYSVRDRVLGEPRAIVVNQKRLLADAAPRSAPIGLIADDPKTQAGGRLRPVGRCPQSAPETACTSDLSDKAMRAALAAYEQAFRAPSVHGLPSAAAVTAYLSILPEPEAGIRAKLADALAPWRLG
jgi:hypothetical protein